MFRLRSETHTARSSGCEGHNENQVVLGKKCCGAENSAKAAGVGLHLSITSSSKSAVTSRVEQHQKPKWPLKDIVHPKMKIRSSFLTRMTWTNVWFFCSFEASVIYFNCKEYGKQSLNFHLSCSTMSYGFGTTYFGWTIPLCFVFEGVLSPVPWLHKCAEDLEASFSKFPRENLSPS